MLSQFRSHLPRIAPADLAIILSLATFAMVGAAIDTARAAESGHVQLVAGKHATIDVPTRSAPRAPLTIETSRVGVAGSRLAVTVDGASKPVFATLLSDRQCRFDDQGSRCRISISHRSQTYRALVTAFERGRTAHVEVTNAGSMLMSEDVSLAGFRKAHRQAAR
jgi:hypothetical protein